jgi:flagellar secretion chaperone FliS
MHHTKQAFAAYGQAAETAAPAQQIVMLYESAIVRLRQARAAIEEGRIEERFRLVERVRAIVDALHGCLDFDNGGEIAVLLDRFYAHVSARLLTINLRNDPSICDELAARLSEMRDAWANIARSSGHDATAAARRPVRAPLPSGDAAPARLVALST